MGGGLALDTGPAADGVWPDAELDVDALLRRGWRPAPLRQFILKLHSRCNLGCDYCYVYRSADQSWRNQPPRMTPATVAQISQRIGEHVRRHGLSEVRVTLHGGEPLLVGPDHLDLVCTTLRSAMPAGVFLDLCVQTNGTLLDIPRLDVLRRHQVRVGVSLDGLAVTHDASRSDAGGRGSHALVTAGLGRLRSAPYRHLFAGLLCVVDLRADPLATYEHLVAYEPPVVDFLLPHANWANPPRGTSDQRSAPYGEWLIAAFDRWCSARHPETSVRLFQEIIRGLVGRASHVETIGLSPARLAVVETDGSIEQLDALKSAYHGAAATGLSVDHDPFDAALLLPGIVARQIGVEALSGTCRRCPIVRVCGGGHYPHRYHPATGFRNPSVYCEDLAVLIRHMASRLRDAVRICRVPRSA